MSGKKRYTSGRDICISTFLITTMVLRLFIENAALFTVLAVFSFIAAVYDVYLSVEENYGCYRKFLVVRGAFLVGAVTCVIVVAVFVILSRGASTKVIDELSLLALFASLPKELHCRLLGNYIQGNKENGI